MTRPLALWVAPVSNLAGVARHIIDATRVGVPGWRIAVAAPEGALLDRLRDQGVDVIPMEVEGRPVVDTVRDLRATVSRRQPAIVHSHLAKADFLSAMATVGLPVRLVSTEHHIPEDPLVFHGTKWKARSRQLAHHARIRRFAALIACSESTKRDMLRYWRPSIPVTVILNGVDRLDPPPVRQPGVRVLSLTRLAAEKNVDESLRAFAEVRQRHPSARLTVAGEGDQLAHLQALARELGVADAVEFPGFVDAASAMREHDVLIQPSKADNFSYTLLDAIAHGMGVVASPVGGNPEMLPPQCIVPLGNESAMADAVIEQGLDLARRPNLPTSVPTVRQMTERIAEVYASVIKAGGNDVMLALTAPDPELGAPTASVVTAYFRNSSTIRQQLDALATQEDPPSFEVVIADNEGSAELPAIVAAYHDRLRIRIIEATGTRGQCFARNRGVDAARGELVAMCDADDVVGPRWLRSLTDAVQHEDVLATGPLRLDGLNPEYAWRTYLGVGADADVPSPVCQEPFTFLGYERFIVGCNLGVRRSTYFRLGGMNENILGGSEDVDFSWRAIEAGLSLTVRPEAFVDYRLRTTVRSIYKQRRGYQRSQIQLWIMSRKLGRPVAGKSLRWTIREIAALPRKWWALRDAELAQRYRLAAWSGSLVGDITGQVSERVKARS